MIEAKTAADEIEAGVDGLRSSLQRILYLLSILLVEKGELRLASKDSVYGAE